ncbi:MAG: hypothetical protein AB9M60_10280 [Leptothrix sp. (in: b-proteobacteria)]
MPYVLRNPEGQIDSVHREPVSGGQFVSAEAAELRQWLGIDPARSAGDGFAALDAGLIRVLEDLVDLLVARNVIRITDLPAEAQHKLFARKNFRERALSHALDLGVGGPGSPTDKGLVDLLRFDGLTGGF